MSEPKLGVGDPFAALRAKFVVRTIEQRARLAALHSSLASNSLSAAEFVELRQLCHGLHGAAGTFGFGEISAAAEQAELICNRMLAHPPDVSSGSMSDLSIALERLSQILQSLA